jgi:hypothetical protein
VSPRRPLMPKDDEELREYILDTVERLKLVAARLEEMTKTEEGDHAPE